MKRGISGMGRSMYLPTKPSVIPIEETSTRRFHFSFHDEEKQRDRSTATLVARCPDEVSLHQVRDGILA